MATQRLLNPKLVSILVVWSLWIGGSPGRVFAMPSASLTAGSVSQPASVREAQIETIMSVLSRPQAQVHLRTMGIRLPELKDRLRGLDDDQLAKMAKRADTVKAAGQVELVIAILVVAILVVLLIYLLNRSIEVKDKDKSTS